MLTENTSKAEMIALLPADERQAFINSLTETEAESLLSDWQFLARKDQLPPEGDWDIWLLLAGRGFGKTRTGAEWIRECVEKMGNIRIALVGETQKDLEEVMVEGDSGILNSCNDLITSYRTKPVRIKFKNGSLALGYNANQPEQLRGPQFHIAWMDELAKYRYAREVWDQLQFGLRLGEKPKQLISTTPRPIELIKEICSGHEGKVHITRGKTKDNFRNLSQSFVDKIYKRYEGTRLGRQELEGALLGDIQGALWTHSNIDLYRIKRTFDENGGYSDNIPDMKRILIGVDPAVSSGEEADDHGIVVAGTHQGEGYILEDGSCRGHPLKWAQRAIALHDKYHADGIVVEVNQGGDMVKQTLLTVRSNLNIIEVRATRGKHVRAEPVSALYEQGRVHHVGAFPELEQQMCLMTSEGYVGEKSPDRCDALVWVLTELFPSIIENAAVKIPAFKKRSIV